jgi:hypothetical protein
MVAILYSEMCVNVCHLRLQLITPQRLSQVLVLPRGVSPRAVVPALRRLEVELGAEQSQAFPVGLAALTATRGQSRRQRLQVQPRRLLRAEASAGDVTAASTAAPATAYRTCPVRTRARTTTVPYWLRLAVLTAVTVNRTTFWTVTSFSLVQIFGIAYYFLVGFLILRS